MSKKQHDFYYSFTAPPVQSSSSSTTPLPSAPPAKNSGLPPAYDDALNIPSTALPNSPPPNNSHLEGYILDSSAPTFNQNVDSSHVISMPQPQLGYNGLQETDSNVPLLLDQEHDNEFIGRPAPPGYSLYTATYKTVKDGIISRDEHINEDGEALLQFLYQHNKPPRMKVHFYGYHEETTWTTRSTRNQDGELVEERVPTTNHVEDFNFDIDCSADISPVCQGIYLLPNPKTGEQQTIRELCDQYIHSKNKLKELKLTKEVNWDYSGLTRAFTTAIRESGFYENIKITFKMEDHEIIVKSNHPFSRYLDNTVVKVLLFISCMWIFILPTVWLLKAKFGHSNLKSAWNMTISERDWYGLHVAEVVNSCRARNFHQSPRLFI